MWPVDRVVTGAFTEVQLEGKKRMDADAFLRGCKIDDGSRFMDEKE